MTFRTLLGISKKPLFCLVSWPEENNQLSLVSTKKIASPQQDDLMPGSFCKVKGFEKHLCKVVAIGTEHEMKVWLEEMETSEGMENVEPGADAQPPPKKKPRKASTRPRRGKENKTPARPTKKRPGNILVVGSKMNNEPFRAIQQQQSTPAQKFHQEIAELQTPAEMSSPHNTDMQKELSFSSFSSISISPARGISGDGTQGSQKSGLGKHCTCTCRY